MDPVTIIKEQQKLGDEIASCYNKLSKISQSDQSSEELRKYVLKIKEVFTEYEEKFEKNDKELRPPSSTMERNEYFKSKFVDEVRKSMNNFKVLYGQLKNRFIEENILESFSNNKDGDDRIERQYDPSYKTSKMETVFPADMHNVSILNKGNKIKQLQFILDHLEFRINAFKKNANDVNIDDIRETYKMAEIKYIEHLGGTEDHELTEIFLNLRDECRKIPGVEGYKKKLPFQLPTIDIPTFSGKATEWDTFKELFEQLIIDQPVPNTQKMCILKAKLSGEAAMKISKLPAKDENFEIAWSILNEYYSDKRATTSVYFKSILEAPWVTYNVKSVNMFLSKVNESLQALEVMKLNPEDMHKAFLCFVLQRKLDDNLRIQFEQHLGKSKDLPKVDNLIDFLKQIQYSLEASQDFTKGEFKKVNPQEVYQRSWEASKNTLSQTYRAGNSSYNQSKLLKIKCPLKCAVGHSLYRCSKFRSLSINEKIDKVREHKACSRCLETGHLQKMCPSNFTCKNCGGDHNTLLHREKVPAKTVLVNGDEEDEAVLSTAIVEVKDGNGNWLKCRVLLDGGAQVNIVSKEFRNKLNIKGCKINKDLEGLERKKSSTDEKIGIHLRSKLSKYKTFLNAVVMNKFVSNVPGVKMVLGNFPSHIKLADPKYNIPQGVDLLLSNQFVFDLICDGKIEDPKTKTKLRNTKLGWVAYGLKTANGCKPESSVVSAVHTTCEEVLQKFWEIEEIPKINKFTIAEKQCEQHFEENFRRVMDGKFEVKLPFKNNSLKLGNSSIIAKRRFFALERKLEKSQELRVEYNKFLQEYLKMDHMELINDISLTNNGYYLPHHCVLRPESTTTKLRVVFDASCKTTTNISLNEILHTGPRIQEDLFNILLRFRKHRYVFSADIEKMYRQIWMAENDRNYQLIYWRWNSNENLKTYRLKTVTYGSASAPYLAVKCLQKIAEWKENNFPVEAEAIRNDFYMDDLMTGGDCLESMKKVRENIYNILLEFGMPLRKWCANEKSLLEGLDSSYTESNLNIDSNKLNSVKALGVIWNPKADILSLKCNMEVSSKISKRTILSEISKLFDPLGLIGPVTVKMKMLLQDLWKLNLDWDDKIPDEIQENWIKIKENFEFLNKVNVPRHIICAQPKQIELHGFCDASMKAYGAAIYVRSVDSNGKVYCHLAAAKSRVAPIKTITLPRLELCAGVLLTELMNAVNNSLKIIQCKKIYYSDSSIVLSWIKTDPAKLQVFVSNRVSLIQANSEVADWRHVKTEDNPADLISRGLLGNNIIKNKFWFEGPIFLKEKIIKEEKICLVNDIPEQKKRCKILLTQSKPKWWRNIDHRNNFNFLQNVIAFVLKLKDKIKKSSIKSHLEYQKEALKVLIKDIQDEHFCEEKKKLRSKKNLSKSSNVISLSPILDREDIIRVGGRIDKSDLPFGARHPILLPYKEKIVELLIEELHRKHLHVGQQSLLAIIRQEFWPLRGRQLIKKIINNCYRCFRIEPRQIHQLMGELPKDRVIRTRPFLNTGIDFLGPIMIHHKIRGKRTDKAYVCVFVCFATKAAHLEVVSDLTSAAFIGALKRFVARRGCPLKIYSDNATNFVGAANSLNEIYKLFSDTQHMKNIDQFCAQRNIGWVNIPARSPHVGGLWEACVKSVKKHFYRLTEGTMTYEELYTLMTQIESILNSRPLTPLSDDPNDLQVLTPGHFLIGEPFSTFTDSIENNSYHGIRDHWKSVQTNTEKFWKRWSLEYLSELQKRYKWVTPNRNIKQGTLVLLKDDNTPPICWRRGRVIRTILGSDGLCRTVDVRTSNGETKRSINNVCPFPTEENEVLDKASSNLNNSATYNSMVNPSENNNEMDKPSKEKSKNLISQNCIKSKKKNKIKNKNLFFTLLTLLAFISPVRSKINIHKFKNNAGIFFDEVGTVGLTKTAWSINVHINMTEYTTIMNTVDNAMMSFEKLHIKKADNQTSSYQNLKAIYGRLVNRNEMIMSSISTRVKRSLLPIVGSALHLLFGTMDEKHAEEVTRKLKQNSSNNQYLLNVVRNLSSVQDMTREIFKKQNKAFFKNLEKITNEIESQNIEIHDFQAVLLSLEFERIQEDLIGAIFNTKGNFLNGVLPVKKFKEHIQLIKTNINKNLRLPTEDPIELAKVAKVLTKTTSEFILFEIQVPLINNDVFTAYEIYEYPTIHDGFSVNIYTSSRYMLIDSKKALYYIMKNGNFEHCQKIKELIICKQLHPVFNTRTATICEMQIFLKARKIPDNCEIKIKKPYNYFHQTHSQNTWIFSVYEDTTAEVTCQDKTTQYILSGSGIFEMEADCHLEAEDFHLWTYNNHSMEVNYIFPQLNISADIPKISHLKLSSEIEIYKISDIPKETKFFGFPIPGDDHHQIHYNISLTTFIIIIIIIVIVIWIMKRVCQIWSNYLPATVALPRLV